MPGTARTLLAGMLAALALCTPAIAQMGLEELTPEEYRRMPSWQPAGMATGVTYQADLRHALPEVGTQNPQNSCVGWAVAYAAKTYHEVVDQGWTPDSERRVFSPSYIYNQINNGRDLGSTFPRALDLLKDRGCSTLATMPYRAPDYLVQPSVGAHQEAGKYTIRAWGKVESGAVLRQAIAEGHPVVVGVRTNPVFTSGNYEIFNQQLLDEGDSELIRQGARGGGHAMCAVGYDDSRRAVLLMNSWGTGWGEDGYCWIDYDLIESIEPGDFNFMREAYVLYDERTSTPVERPTPRSEPVASYDIRARTWYGGHVKDGHTWRWKLWIDSTPRGLEQVSEVRWTVDRTTRSRSTPVNGFELIGERDRAGAMDVIAQITLRSGRSVRQQHRLDFVAPKPSTRDLKLAQSDRYWGLVTFDDGDTKPFWEWTILIEGDLTDLADIRQVIYHLHPTFPDPDRVVTSSPADGFSHTTRGWGGFNVSATVEFTDGSTSKLSHRLRFQSDRIDDLALRNTSQFVGVQDELPRWDWSAFVVGPLAKLERIDRVVYKLHPTFHNRERSVTDGVDDGFALFTNGWGTFLLEADVYLEDGWIESLSHELVFEVGRAPSLEGGENIYAPQKK